MALRERAKSMEKRIQLVRLAAWGEVLMTTATFPALIEAGYRIRYVTTSGLAPLLEHNPWVDELVTMPFVRSGNPIRQRRLRLAVEEATSNLRSADKTIYFRNSPNYSFLRDILNRVLPDQAEVCFPVRHQLYDVCRQAGVPFADELSLHLTPEELAWGQAYSDCVFIQMFSSSPHKDWPVVYWERLVERLKSEFGLRVLQLGRPEQTVPGIEKFDEPRLRYVLAALYHARLFIGPDSVFNHVHRAFHKPAIILYGPTHPARFGYSQNVNLWHGHVWDYDTMAYSRVSKAFASKVLGSEIDPRQCLMALNSVDLVYHYACTLLHSGRQATSLPSH